MYNWFYLLYSRNENNTTLYSNLYASKKIFFLKFKSRKDMNKQLQKKLKQPINIR